MPIVVGVLAVGAGIAWLWSRRTPAPTTSTTSHKPPVQPPESPWHEGDFVAPKDPKGLVAPS